MADILFPNTSLALDRENIATTDAVISNAIRANEADMVLKVLNEHMLKNSTIINFKQLEDFVDTEITFQDNYFMTAWNLFLIKKFELKEKDHFVSLDSKGFYFGASTAGLLGGHVVEGLKPEHFVGNLNNDAYSTSTYSSEYAGYKRILFYKQAIEAMMKDPMSNILISDDFVASGNTLGAVVDLFLSKGINLNRIYVASPGFSVEALTEENKRLLTYLIQNNHFAFVSTFTPEQKKQIADKNRIKEESSEQSIIVDEKLQYIDFPELEYLTMRYAPIRLLERIMIQHELINTFNSSTNRNVILSNPSLLNNISQIFFDDYVVRNVPLDTEKETTLRNVYIIPFETNGSSVASYISSRNNCNTPIWLRPINSTPHDEKPESRDLEERYYLIQGKYAIAKSVMDNAKRDLNYQIVFYADRYIPGMLNIMQEIESKCGIEHDKIKLYVLSTERSSMAEDNLAQIDIIKDKFAQMSITEDELAQMSITEDELAQIEIAESEGILCSISSGSYFGKLNPYNTSNVSSRGKRGGKRKRNEEEKYILPNPSFGSLSALLYSEDELEVQEFEDQEEAELESDERASLSLNSAVKRSRTFDRKTNKKARYQ